MLASEDVGEGAAWESGEAGATREGVVGAPESDAAEASEPAPAETPPASGTAEDMSLSFVMNRLSEGT